MVKPIKRSSKKRSSNKRPSNKRPSNKRSSRERKSFKGGIKKNENRIIVDKLISIIKDNTPAENDHFLIGFDGTANPVINSNTLQNLLNKSNISDKNIGNYFQIIFPRDLRYIEFEKMIGDDMERMEHFYIGINKDLNRRRLIKVKGTLNPELVKNIIQELIDNNVPLHDIYAYNLTTLIDEIKTFYKK